MMMEGGPMENPPEVRGLANEPAETKTGYDCMNMLEMSCKFDE
jgi:hypothetical protein